MTPGQDNKSKDFFQKQWHRPLHRFGKVIMPVIVSSMIIFSLFFVAIMGISYLLMIKGDSHKILLYTSFSVAFGTFFAIVYHIVQQHRQSRFMPILVRKINAK